MLAVLLFLGAPVLAGILLSLDHHVRHDASRDELSSLAVWTRLTAIALAATGAATITIATQNHRNAVAINFSDVLFHMTAGVYGLLSVTTAVVGNAFRRHRDPANLREEARVEQRASLFRLLAWIVVLTPLVPLLPAVLIVVPLAITLVLTSWGAINRGTRVSLLWRLAIATENGLPLADEVEAAAAGATRSRREALMGMADAIRNGRSLADALEVGTPLLPRSTVLSIRAAEGTAALPAVLRSAARLGVRDLTDLRVTGAALPVQAYVVCVVTICAMISAFLMYWIVPKFKEIFNDFGVELPAPTIAFIHFSDNLFQYWYILGPLFCIPLGLFLLPPVIALAGWENLNYPLLMRWFPRLDAPGVLRMMATVVTTGKPMAVTVAELAEHEDREDLQLRLARVADDMAMGETSWSVLSREHFLRPREAAALDAAARNNHLPWALNSLADTLDSRNRIRTAWILEWQRPILIGLVGALVAWVGITFFLPLVTMLHALA